jgi:trehalose-phosphatase
VKERLVVLLKTKKFPLCGIIVLQIKILVYGRNLLEKSILVNYPIDIIQGKKNLEIRPALMNKGEIAKAILNLYSKASFIFCAGDDRTDEDMFQIVNEVGRERSFYATCIIGTPHVATHAKYYLNAPEELIEKLNELLL